jgi:hypothetical protein
MTCAFFHKRRTPGVPALAAVAVVAGLVSSGVFTATPAAAQSRDIRDTVREAKEPRKTVKLPTRPSSRPVHVPTRPLGDHANSAPARPGKQKGDRAPARPGHHHAAEPRTRDFRDKRPHGS